MLEVYMKAYGGMMQAAYTHNSTRGGVMRLDGKQRREHGRMAIR